MVDQSQLKSLWNRVVDRVKLEINHPSFYKAVEVAVPIVTEDNFFVIGFAPINLYQAGHLNVSERKNAIEKALFDFTGTKYEVRIIEGDTLQDWQILKESEARRRQLREYESQHKKVETASQKAWEKLLIQAGRRYAALPYRGMPQYRAIYIADMVTAMSEAIDELMVVEGDKVDELGQRQLSRIIERVAQLSEVPGPMIGLELHRYRKSLNK